MRHFRKMTTCYVDLQRMSKYPQPQHDNRSSSVSSQENSVARTIWQGKPKNGMYEASHAGVRLRDATENYPL